MNNLKNQNNYPCHYFNQNLCKSCQFDHTDYQNLRSGSYYKDQVRKNLSLKKDFEIDFFPSTNEFNFRNKAKMVVGGTTEEPSLGLINNIDLTSCPLYPQEFELIFNSIKKLITFCKITPYSISEKKGELKNVIVFKTKSSNELIVRFILRSRESIDRIKKNLPLFQEFPFYKEVFTVNIQPEHKAILEGDEEIILTPKKFVIENLNGIPLHLTPKSFFQTNSDVASELYQTAGNWCNDINVTSFWDLFCGVGGFAFHIEKSLQEKITLAYGLEIDPNAIYAGKETLKHLKNSKINFTVSDLLKFDSFNFEKIQRPDLIIVNPPRRGVGENILNLIKKINPHYLLYSSCESSTLGSDCQELSDQYNIKKVKVFEMFPHTLHFETLVLLNKNEVDKSISP